MWLRLRDAVKIVPGEATPEMSVPSQEPWGSQMRGTPPPASPVPDPWGVLYPSLAPMLGLRAGGSGSDQCSGSERPCDLQQVLPGVLSLTSVSYLGTRYNNPNTSQREENRHRVMKVKAEVRHDYWVTLYSSPS